MTEETVQAVEPSLPEIVAELRVLDARKAELEAAALKAKREALTGIVDTIRKYITDNGLVVDEIAALLAPHKKRKGPSTKAGTKQAKVFYTSKADPSHVYVRGVLPGWMKAEMAALGLNPEDKEARDRFKAEHMTSSAGSTGQVAVTASVPAPAPVELQEAA